MRIVLLKRTMSTSTKHPISALPLPPSAHIITHALTPDPVAPSVSAFKKLLAEKPSAQRRARLLAPDAHFSYVAPFPQPFPFEISPPEPPAVVEDKAAYVEQWLAAREAVHPRGAPSPSGLRLHYPENREQPRELIGLAETGLRECLPALDVGDALSVLGTPTLSHEFEDETTPQESAQADVDARTQLVDVLSGHAALMSDDGAEVPFAPWSIRYSGHQFGNWAGQLGDGRATSVRAYLLSELVLGRQLIAPCSHDAPSERSGHDVGDPAEGRGPHALLALRRRAGRPALVHPRIPLCRRCVHPRRRVGS